MSIKFIHTADLQIAKPYGSLQDDTKRVLLQQKRIEVLNKIKDLAISNKAEFIVTAGDMFDSSTPTKHDVSQTCSLIGSIELPVFVIPGNHDNGGPGGIWGQDFFLKEKNSLSPNLQVLLEPKLVELDNAILFPCPLLRRHESLDLTAWLRNFNEADLISDSKLKTRIVIAHGSTQNFGSGSSDDEEYSVSNLIDIQRLPENEFDYIALGDWHGTKQITEKAWYAGTPEIDRFIKGAYNDPGNVLIVTAERGEEPIVEKIRTTAINWFEKDFEFLDETSLNLFNTEIGNEFQTRTSQDLLKLTLRGYLGLDQYTQLENLLEVLEARLIRVKLDNKIKITPTEQEIESLKNRTDDPLISTVADKLLILSALGNEEEEIARVALRELYAVCNNK